MKKCSMLYTVVKYMFFLFLLFSPRSFVLHFVKALAMLCQTDHESENSSNAKQKILLSKRRQFNNFLLIFKFSFYFYRGLALTCSRALVNSFHI